MKAHDTTGFEPLDFVEWTEFCARCDGHGRDCGTCDGTGWVRCVYCLECDDRPHMADGDEVAHVSCWEQERAGWAQQQRPITEG